MAESIAATSVGGLFRGEEPAFSVLQSQQNRRLIWQLRTAMLNPAQSTETWKTLIELRCQREVIERWLASCSLPNELQQNLHAMLADIDRRLQALTNQSHPVRDPETLKPTG